MQKIRISEVPYTACDWCKKEILEGQAVHHFQGDFPTVSFHKEPCLRQAAVTGARSDDAPKDI